MRKNFFVITVLLILSCHLVRADIQDDFAEVDKAWDAQTTITNKDYEDVVNALQEKKDKVEEKKKKRKFRKITGGGKSLHNEISPEKNIKEIPDIKPAEEGVLINLPVNLLLDNIILEQGYYKVVAERDEQKKIHIKFYQSQFLKGEIIAEETEDDYEEEFIDFAKVLPYNDSFVKMIFGSIDFNAYALIPFQN